MATQSHTADMLGALGITEQDMSAPLEGRLSSRAQLNTLFEIGNNIADRVDENDAIAYLRMSGVCDKHIEAVVKARHSNERYHTVNRIKKLVATASKVTSSFFTRLTMGVRQKIASSGELARPPLERTPTFRT